MDSFNEAAKDDGQTEHEQAQKIAEHGAMLSFAAMGAGICLVSLIGERAKHEEAIIDSVPENIYKLAYSLARQHGKAPEGTEEKPNGIINPTADRTWPLLLTEAVYISCGLTPDGKDPRTGTLIINCVKDFPEQFRPLQHKVAEAMQENLTDFIDIATMRVEKALGFQENELNPLYLFLAVEHAQKRGIKIFDDPRLWLPECLDHVFVLARTVNMADLEEDAAAPPPHLNLQ